MMRSTALILLTVVLFAHARASLTKSSRIEMRLLPVPYQAQINEGACRDSALWMFMMYKVWAPHDKEPDSQEAIEKKLRWYSAKSPPDPSSHEAREAYLRGELGETFSVEWRYKSDADQAWMEITQSLDMDFPVPLSSSLTKSGHVLLIIGYWIEGGNRYLFCHDPFGRYDIHSNAYQKNKPGIERGRCVLYPFEKLKVKTTTGEDWEYMLIKSLDTIAPAAPNGLSVSGPIDE